MRWSQTARIVALILSVSNMSGVPTKVTSVFSEGLGFWSDDGRRFFLGSSRNDMFLHKLKSMVMVSFKPGSAFESEIKSDRRLVAVFRDYSTGVGRAILTLTSPLERDALAVRVHEHTHLCGSLEVLDMNLQALTIGDAYSPQVPTTVNSSAVSQLLEQVSTYNMSSTILSLENLGTRYHAGTTPNQASDAIKTTWQSLLPAGASIAQMDHEATKSTSQKSVIVTIPSSITATETVVLGAHLDSINRSDQTKAPGADDNASGIAGLTEILRIIKASGASFSRNIEIHAYAAEEVGLLGSADIASHYISNSKSVTAMLQLDMTAFSAIANDDSIYLITTDTSPVLVRHLKDLIATYELGTMKTGTLSAGTSDHKSWTNGGFHAAFIFENPEDYNHSIHTSSDTQDRLDLSLAARFTKLALAFLAHEAGLTTAKTDTEATWLTQKATSALIKLAAYKTTTGERFAAAVTGAAASAEFCRIKAGTEVGCQSMVTDTGLAKETSGRVFFVTASDVTIAEDEIWRLNAYTSNGSLLAMRNFRLKKN